MAWIELHQALRTHPKLIQMATLLKIEPDLVRAKLENLWLWALDYCPKGDLTVASRGMTAPEIAVASGWHGQPTVWLKSLISAGFIEAKQGGKNGRTLYLHDWQDYGGKWCLKRDADAARKREKRYPLDIHRTSAGHPPDGAGREEKRREEKRTGEKRREEEKTRTPEPAVETTKLEKPTNPASPSSLSAFDSIVDVLADEKKPATSSRDEVIRQLVQAIKAARCPNKLDTIREWATSWHARYGAQAVHEFWMKSENAGKDILQANNEMVKARAEADHAF